MGFSEDLKSEMPSTSCNVKLLLEKLEPEDRDGFQSALDDTDGVPANAIDRAIKRGGYDQACGVRSILRHRREECVCFIGVTP